MRSFSWLGSFAISYSFSFLMDWSSADNAHGVLLFTCNFRLYFYLFGIKTMSYETKSKLSVWTEKEWTCSTICVLNLQTLLCCFTSKLANLIEAKFLCMLKLPCSGNLWCFKYIYSIAYDGLYILNHVLYNYYYIYKFQGYSHQDFFFW